MAALVPGCLPDLPQPSLCANRGCSVLYFGESGGAVPLTELSFLPAFKSESPEALLCCCFLHRRGDLIAELAAHGSSTLLERIGSRVKAGECSCSVRNPTGRCCLREVGSEIDRLCKEM